jgi:hypothetical protein
VEVEGAVWQERNKRKEKREIGAVQKEYLTTEGTEKLHTNMHGVFIKFISFSP